MVPNANPTFPGLIGHCSVLMDIDIMPGKTFKVGDIGLAELALDWHLQLLTESATLRFYLINYLD